MTPLILFEYIFAILAGCGLGAGIAMILFIFALVFGAVIIKDFLQ